MNLSITLFLIRILLIIILAFSAYNFHYCTATMEFVFSIFVPVMIYSNAETDKSKIFTDNKGKAGIYQWTHEESGKRYVGSAYDLSERIYQYYSPSHLKRVDNIICRALLLHGYGAFSLSIIDYIDIDKLSKKQAREKILEREQYYLDSIFLEDKPNTFNILKVAGSSLGYKHTPESLVKMSEAQSGENNPMFGKTGVNNSFFGKTHSAESITKMSEAKIGENHPMKKNVFVYSFNLETKVTILDRSFNTCIEAAKYFDCSTRSISRYLDKNKLYKKQWILSSSLITKE